MHRLPIDDHLERGASSTVTSTFTDAAGRKGDNRIHHGAKTDGISGFGEGFFNRNASIRVNRCLHENIKWLNDGKINWVECSDCG